jgi:SAM-dependent methyltransferase
MTDHDNGWERVDCQLCGCSEARTVWASTIDESGADPRLEEFDYTYASVSLGIQRHHRIVRCVRCGLIYVSPRPTQGAGAGIYRRLRDERYASLREERVAHFEQDLVELERFGPTGPLLDVGCGSGYFLEAARRRGWEPVRGVELNSWMVELGREAGLDIASGELREQGYPDGAFQLVSFWDVIEHMNDPRAELAEAHRILRPGGVLALLVPDAESFWARLLGERWWAVIRMHLFYFTRETVTRLLEQSGFAVELVGTYPKRARLGYLNNLFRDQPLLHRTVGSVLEATGLAGREIAVDPRDQMKIIARRVDDGGAVS